MKKTYPIILIPAADGSYAVYIPDFDNNTEGADVSDAIFMARDAIGLLGTTYQDIGRALPEPSSPRDIKAESDQIVTLVDVDFDEYRRKNDQRSVKKNCTLPNWLCYEAEKANINFSQVLQKALKQELNITDR